MELSSVILIVQVGKLRHGAGWSPRRPEPRIEARSPGALSARPCCLPPEMRQQEQLTAGFSVLTGSREEGGGSPKLPGRSQREQLVGGLATHVTPGCWSPLLATLMGEKANTCPYCGKGFRRSSHLTRHLGTHSGGEQRPYRPYSCTHCGKAFGRSAHLARHQETHSGERPYKCTYCGKAFGRNAHLTRHHGTHTGERPYQCGICGRAFTPLTRLGLIPSQQDGLALGRWPSREQASLIQGVQNSSVRQH
uniref:C2H2-type domain-containing protein n=1 Tax=Gopherus evgoodei TaxID=1825980 RepID=A0A8C4YH15_9SAUR